MSVGVSWRKDDGELRHIDLVVLDSEGFPMYAEIGVDAVVQQGLLLAEGNVYRLKQFRVIPAKNSYKPVDSQYMIDITCHTQIEQVHDVAEDFPRYTYRLTPFSSLSNLSGETRAFIDIIGMITEVGTLETIHL